MEHNRLPSISSKQVSLLSHIGSLQVANLLASMDGRNSDDCREQLRPPSLAVVSCAVILALLAGCGGDDFADLNQYISAVKAKPKESIKPLPEIKVIEPFVFKPEGLRDPFKPLDQPELAEGVDASKGSGIRPDTTRRKEELENFPLDGLKMVGTVNMQSSLWGLVKASDGTIYRVHVGNYMGKNHGKIIRILNDKIELMEIVPDKPGTWREQQTSLTLTE